MDGGGEEAGRGRPDDPWDGGSLGGWRVLGQERLEAEACIPIPAIGIEDPDGGPPARRPGPAAGDEDLGGLAHDVPPEPDPGLPGELEADPRPLPDRGGHRAVEPRRLQDEEGDPRPPGKGGKPAEPIGELRRALGPGREVDDEEVHGPPGQERAGDRQALLRAGRRDHDQPGRVDPPGHRLHGIEGIGEVQPGDDRAVRLRLGGEPEGDGGPPTREVAAQREAHPPGQPAGPEDRIQCREPGGVDLRGVSRHLGGGDSGPETRIGIRCEQWKWRQGERSHHVPGGARRRRSPARSKGRQGCRHVRGKGGHQVLSIEHLF
jgi:hypothetical protein